MDEFLKWLAGYGGEELPEGEMLRFEFLSLPKGGLGLLAVVGFVLVAASIFLIYRRDAARHSLGRRITLASLRLLALACVALMLLEPSLVRVRKVVRPGEVLVLLDTSQSMSHKDSYQRSEEWAAGWKEIGEETPHAASRLDLAKRLLSQKGLFESLGAKNRVRAWLFGGSARAAPEVDKVADAPGAKPGTAAVGSAPPAPPATTGELPPPPEIEFGKIEATESSTNLTASLRQALEQSRDARIAAVVVVTDGRRNAGGSPEEAGAFLKRRKVEQVLVVGVGDPAEAWTTSLREIHVAERVFKGDPMRVTAIVTSQGYPQQTLNVRLVEVDATGAKIRDISQTTVEVGGDRSAAEAKFPPVEFKKEGDHFVRVELEPPDGAPKDESHEKVQKVEVLSERLNVLLIAGGPSHEYRILRNQLIRDNTINVACWLESADADFPQDGNTSIKELPKTPQELDAYDVVLMIDPDPLLLEKGFPSMVAKAVVDRGLGLWFVMGEKFSLQCVSAGSVMTPIVELLPVEIDLPTAEQWFGWGRYWPKQHPYKLTKLGRDHRVTALVTDSTVNELLWSKLPGFYVHWPVARAKPAATVLVEHSDRTFRAQEGNHPLLAGQFVGAGRVLYSGTDELYRWRSVAEHAYNIAWVNGLRWLYEGKLTGGSSRYRLGTSAQNLTLGNEIEIYLRALDQNFAPLVAETVTVRIHGPNGILKDLALKKAPVGEGRYQGAFRPNAVGTWTVAIDAADGAPDSKSRPVLFEVAPSELESQGPMELAQLTRFAETAAGSLVKPKDLLTQAAEIKTASTEETFTLPRPLWDRWLTLAVIVLLLSAEWILRKRYDLL